MSAYGTFRYRGVGRKLEAGVLARPAFGSIATATLHALIAVVVLI
ncbi:hypothetical protein ACVH9Z_20425 [Rhodococcus opacus]